MIATSVTAPFDQAKLDREMERAGIDLVLATSSISVPYLLGGYRSHFFATQDAIGISRYLPALGYVRGALEDAFFVGSCMETDQQVVDPIWVPAVSTVTFTTRQAASEAAKLICDRGLAEASIGVEMPFLPADAYATLRELLPGATFVDAVRILEAVRAVKRPDELALLREASEAIVDSMLSVFHSASPGMTTQQLSTMLREAEIARGLTFDYCLAATGSSLNRAPSFLRWEKGTSLSLDSGGSKDRYIGDLARMAIWGEPSSEQREILHEIDTVQMAARSPIKAGARGYEIYERALAALAQCPHRDKIEFVAHGMGLVSHECPRLTDSGPVPYPADDADMPLQAGMVVSIETTYAGSNVGFIKLEDTIAVTDTGWEAFGDSARGWNVVEHG